MSFHFFSFLHFFSFSFLLCHMPLSELSAVLPSDYAWWYIVTRWMSFEQTRLPALGDCSPGQYLLNSRTFVARLGMVMLRHGLECHMQNNDLLFQGQIKVKFIVRVVIIIQIRHYFCCIFQIADPFTTKPSLMACHHKLEYFVITLDCSFSRSRSGLRLKISISHIFCPTDFFATALRVLLYSYL